MDIYTILFVIGFVLYIWVKALDYGFSSLNRKKIKFSADEGDEKSIELNKCLEIADKIESSIQFCYIIAFALICYCSVKVFDSQIYHLLDGVLIEVGESIFICVLIVVLFVFGNIVTKKIGTKNCNNIIYSSRKILKFLCLVLTPVIVPSLCIGNFISKIFGADVVEDTGSTEEEILMLVGSSGNFGDIEESEKEMINNIFEFNNTMVGDIATHRTEIVAVPVESSFEEVIAVIKGEKFSRIPVYNENIDDIIGFFRVRDLLKFYDNKSKEQFKLEDIMFDPFYVPFSKKIDNLFKEMQENKLQMAMIIDEYGGTAGIVTMEDLIEEIVGNIFDEYDVEEDEIQELEENIYLVKGTTEIEEVEETIGISFDNEGEYDTIGGFVIGQLGRIPDEEEKPRVIFKNLILTVEEIEDKRIETIRILKVINSEL